MKEVIGKRDPAEVATENFGVYKDAVKNPPKSSGLYIGLVGITLDLYLIHYRASRRVYEIWGLGRKEPTTDMNVVLWTEAPELGKCPECGDKLVHPGALMFKNAVVCGPCYEIKEKEHE